VWQADELYPALVDTGTVLNLSTTSTSVTSNTISTGNKTFTVQADKGYVAGQSLSIARTAAPTNRMFAVVTSYDIVTGALGVTVQAIEGSGTYTDWSIALAFNGVVNNAQLANGYINDLTAVTFDNGVDYVPVADGSDSGNKKKSLLSSSKIQPITASVAANALTITLNPTTLDFRDATATSGTINTRNVPAAISITVPNTATLGTVNNVQNRLAILAIDNSGTVELAITNLAGGLNLDETSAITTGVLDTTSDGANAFYSTTARTNVPYRVVGFVESTQATAGVWATSPSKIQGYGGQAFAAMSSFGFGQTWQNLTGSRAYATTYYNTTGKPIQIFVQGSSSIANASVTCTVAGVSFPGHVQSVVGGSCVNQVTVPPNASYSADINATKTLLAWIELR
jgi:hypothetical protein